MAGAQIRVDVRDLERLAGSLDAPGHELRDLSELLAGEVESQTRRRVQVEKRSPAGVPWAPWSPSYARTRHGGHSLLRSRGGLLDSLVADASADGFVVGSNLVYAATHQFGRGNIPARPYLGMNRENERDLEVLAAEWLDDYFARGGRRR